MQFHPFAVSSLVCSGKGGSGGDETKKNTEGSSPLINLELEVGGGLVGKSSVAFKQEEEEENTLFTDAQFHELYLQVVIFKYLSSGLSVPFHLVLLIWKSFAISSGCGFSPSLFVNGSTMDPEPGRCRRTDGKKWRCYGSVVPDQKYCERHMHRGSQRSRKLVEASKNILKSNNEDLPSDKKLRSSISYSRTSVSHGRISVPVSTTLDLTPPSATAEAGFTSISYKSNSECSSSSTNVAQVDSSTAVVSSLLKAQAVKNNSTRNLSNWNDFLGNSNSGKPSSVATGFGVSPKSVLQGDIGTSTGYRNLSFDNKTGTQNEALRCRRTDGKRWRCSRVVVPSKKYCENHLHRGSKKAATTAAAVAGASCVRKPAMSKNYRVLDTNLSISIAANPQQIFDNDASSSSSDATTVSDENVCHFHTL